MLVEERDHSYDRPENVRAKAQTHYLALTFLHDLAAILYNRETGISGTKHEPDQNLDECT